MEDKIYKNISLKDIEDVIKELDYYFIGEVSPGCYQIGKGMYTGIRGYENFIKILNEEINKF